MRRVKTIVAGVLLGIGLPISIVCTWNLFQPIDSTTAPTLVEAQRSLNLATLIFYGLVPVTMGSGLALSNNRQGQQSQRDRLQAVFFRLLQEGDGQINVLRFSMEANISGSEAKVYLDDRAREFNAAFNVSEEGKVFYYFDGEFNTPALSPASGEETYDVILEYVPSRRRREVVSMIQQLTELDERQAKRLLRSMRSQPVTIAEALTKKAAARFRRQLESAGASVLVVLR